MKNKWTKITLLSTVLIASVGFGTVAQAAGMSQEVPGKAVTKFKAPDTGDPADPSDPEDPNPKPIVPTDPKDPLKPTYPGGPLRFNHIPTINFGVNNINSKTVTHMAQFEEVVDVQTQNSSPKASFVEVADLTGKLEGWKVTVASDGVFESDDNKIVNGIITLKANADAVRGLDGMNDQKDKFPTANNNIVLGGGTAQNVDVLTATAGKGMNKWQVRYGAHENTAAIVKGDDDTDRNPNVTLTVPQGQAVLADKAYVATLKWTLTQGV